MRWKQVTCIPYTASLTLNLKDYFGILSFFKLDFPSYNELSKQLYWQPESTVARERERFNAFNITCL